MIYIDACFSHLNVVKDKHEDLAAFVREKTGQKMRRVDRYTLLAIAGAMQCSAEAPLQPEAAMVLATQTGTLSTTIDMMHKIGIEKRPPKPFQFVNSLGNSACYSLARMFSISGPSLAVSKESFSFESGLQHADLLMTLEAVPQVMVGGLDEAPLPISDHLRRHVDDSEVEKYDGCYEGSHWLRVSKSPSASTVASLEMLPEYSIVENERFEHQLLSVINSAFADYTDQPCRIFANFDPRKYECEDDSINELFDQSALPETAVLVHGTYSGHSFVKACDYIKTTSDSAIALVITLSATGDSLSLALLGSVGAK